MYPSMLLVFFLNSFGIISQIAACCTLMLVSSFWLKHTMCPSMLSWTARMTALAQPVVFPLLLPPRTRASSDVSIASWILLQPAKLNPYLRGSSILAWILSSCCLCRLFSKPGSLSQSLTISASVNDGSIGCLVNIKDIILLPPRPRRPPRSHP